MKADQSTNRMKDRTRHRHRLGLRRVLARALTTGAAALALSAGGEAAAAESKTLCVFDPGGANGDLFAKMKSYQAEAVSLGVNFTLRPYTDESVAASDFRNKQCDAVLLTGVTGREFNPKTYTLEALGLFPTYAALGKAVSRLAMPKLASISVSEGFETVGVYPAGAVYLHLRDRENASLPRLSGRSIATIGGDPAARTMVNRVGATATRAEVGTFASMFNNGSVDVCYSPATAYAPMELHRGVGSKGGVVRYPLAQLTFQIYVRAAEFPEGFGQASRELVAGHFSSMVKLVEREEAKVQGWIEIAQEDAARYDELLRQVRDTLKAEKVYDGAVLLLGAAR